ncbi:MAG TPA: restriction endonuclease subunit R [Planctomycetes bacterium]|nr:restriction endonuclease subunit R [Planctomycetota bacterium]
MTQFAFLQAEWPAVAEAASRAEAAVQSDARTACFYARRALELAVRWVFTHDAAVKLPYQDNLSALIHEPTFKQAAGAAVFTKARLIVQYGNQAVHSTSPIRQFDALTVVRELFHVGYWLAHTYARGAKPAPGSTFNQKELPAATAIPKQTAEQLQAMQARLSEQDAKLTEVLADRAALSEELKQVRAEVAKAKAAAAAQPDSHDYSEAETRDAVIDLLLTEAGWKLDQSRDREFEVAGMPNNEGKGFVDYVLWGDNGQPLAVVEAKRTKRDPRVGQQQAKLYADCLEKRYGRRPLIFYSNGYEHWFWDDQHYPPRAVQGFLTKGEMELTIQRRTSRLPLAEATINGEIVERFYQTRAIRRIAEAFEKDHDRKALVVMATGAGKTRTVIALADLLMRCNWAKRVLFLADRVALVNQALNAFKRHLPEAAPVNLVTDKNTEGRVFVSTYPTMMGLIDETTDGRRRFGVGHFDLIIIDEAHRSVFAKYRAIFDYFDSLLVGLTATPKDEVDRNTYGLFDLEDGVPTDAYDLKEAVGDGFLVPPKAVSVPLKFQREGIEYDKLSPEEQEQWDALEWEEGEVPDKVSAEALNKWLFNKDTVDKVLAHLMTKGQTVAGGDRLGKTILFAKNQQHAEFIEERFNANYPHLKGSFARIITFKTEYAQSLIDDFSNPEKAPHLAISVDMLDTGIDVPEVVNLVFFKVVRSKTKFWQMIGRGTRLRPDLFGPGMPKAFFYVFDYCQNLEYFKENPDATDGTAGASLGTRLFRARLELIGVLDKQPLPAANKTATVGYDGPITGEELRRDLATLLHSEVAAMNLDNFAVRPKRKLVERYGDEKAWRDLTTDAHTELSEEVAGLPSEREPENEEAKRFDLLLLNLQLARLSAEPSFERLMKQVQTIAGLLEEKSAIPMVKERLALIHDLQTEEWWQDVTVPMLEAVRRRLRDLIHLIDKQARKPLYPDFEDELGEGSEVELPGVMSGGDFEKFRTKARAFLLAHQEIDAIRKLRSNVALNPGDLAELERVLKANGIGGDAEITKAKEEAQGLGLFVRSLIGLDREAAKSALAGFVSGSTLTANQIEFVNLIVNYLTEHGVMDAGLLYESPFTDIAPRGPDSIFTATQVTALVEQLERVRRAATAA